MYFEKDTLFFNFFLQICVYMQDRLNTIKSPRAKKKILDPIFF